MGSEKLKEAYVKARYSKHYRISEEEVAWLGCCVEELGRVVHTICSKKITTLVHGRSKDSQRAAVKKHIAQISFNLVEVILLLGFPNDNASFRPSVCPYELVASHAW